MNLANRDGTSLPKQPYFAVLLVTLILSSPAQNETASLLTVGVQAH